MIASVSEHKTLDFTAIAQTKNKSEFASFKVLGSILDNSNKDNDFFSIEMIGEKVLTKELEEKSIDLTEFKKTLLLFLRCISIFLHRRDNCVKNIEPIEITNYCKSLIKEVMIFKKFEVHTSYFQMNFEFFNTQVEAKFYR